MTLDLICFAVISFLIRGPSYPNMSILELDPLWLKNGGKLYVSMHVFSFYFVSSESINAWKRVWFIRWVCTCLCNQHRPLHFCIHVILDEGHLLYSHCIQYSISEDESSWQAHMWLVCEEYSSGHFHKSLCSDSQYSRPLTFYLQPLGLISTCQHVEPWKHGSVLRTFSPVWSQTSDNNHKSFIWL